MVKIAPGKIKTPNLDKVTCRHSPSEVEPVDFGVAQELPRPAVQVPVTGVKRLKTLTTSACGRDLHNAITSLIKDSGAGNVTIIKKRKID